MPLDKYTATWVSHTSISDFLRCPRAYFLKHMYRDPKTHHKIKLMNPSLALGSSVHEVLESLSILPKEKRFLDPLVAKFERAWEKVAGKRGGFPDIDTEYRYKTRGIEMLRRVEKHPGPVAGLAVKIKQDLPYFWLSEEENIILCGKIDWLEYLPDTNSVHIIDFKTGKSEEDEESLQLPIYHLLVHHCQERPATRASYWYLSSSDTITETTLPTLADARAKVLKIAQNIKLARQLDRMKCPDGADGCRDCRPLEAIVAGRGECVGVDEYGYDVYILPQKSEAPSRESDIL